jgi:hypothetical protein
MACERCRGSSIVVVDHLETCSDGVSSIMWYSEEPCPVCVTGTEQPEWPDDEEPPEEKGDEWTDYFTPCENATPTSVTCSESATRSTARTAAT